MSVELLCATWAVFGEQERIHTADLLAGLNAMEDAPWSSWNDSEGLRPIDFTNRVIKHFKLHHSQSIRIGDENRKGYEREWFEAAWVRYGRVTGTSPLKPTPLPVTSLALQGKAADSYP